MNTPTPPSPNPNPQPPIITLTTDFGTADTYVAQMKGVIAGITLSARVIDSTHDIPPQNILAGALALDTLVDAFPDGTIHVAVVDPGVGSQRAAVAIQTERFTLVGPDNGLFTMVLDRYPPTTIVSLTNPAYHRSPGSPGSPICPTFHGRDIFAPAAAHLADGVPISQLGDPCTTLVNLNLRPPEVSPKEIKARVLTSDRFGNLITNLSRDVFEAWLSEQSGTKMQVRVKGKKIGTIQQTFADVKTNEPVAYFGSSNRLEIAVREGSARDRFGNHPRVVVYCA